MFGPLPRLHRIALIGAAIVFFVVAGVWLAKITAAPVPAGGFAVGATAGLVAAYVLTHQFHSTAREARVHRRR